MINGILLDIAGKWGRYHFMKKSGDATFFMRFKVKSWHKSGGDPALPRGSPLRTVHARFLTYGSSLSKPLLINRRQHVYAEVDQVMHLSMTIRMEQNRIIQAVVASFAAFHAMMHMDVGFIRETLPADGV